MGRLLGLKAKAEHQTEDGIQPLANKSRLGRRGGPPLSKFEIPKWLCIALIMERIYITAVGYFFRGNNCSQ